jgi:hypothetical protein
MRRHGTRQTNLICEIERAFGTLCWAQKLFVVHGGDLCNGDAALQHAALSCNVQRLLTSLSRRVVLQKLFLMHTAEICAMAMHPALRVCASAQRGDRSMIWVLQSIFFLMRRALQAN